MKKITAMPTQSVEHRKEGGVIDKEEVKKAREDRLIYGIGFLKDGKCIDPRNVFIENKEEPKREEKARE